jgi:hypothetical protein
LSVPVMFLFHFDCWDLKVLAASLNFRHKKRPLGEPVV